MTQVSLSFMPYLLNCKSTISPEEKLAQTAFRVKDISAPAEGRTPLLVPLRNSFFCLIVFFVCFFFTLPHRPQSITSSRAWSVVEVRRWFWVRAGWFMKEASCRFSRAPGGSFHASPSQTTPSRGSSLGTRWVKFGKINIIIIIIIAVKLHQKYIF